MMTDFFTKEKLDKLAEILKKELDLDGVQIIPNVYIKENTPILLVSPKIFNELITNNPIDPKDV